MPYRIFLDAPGNEGSQLLNCRRSLFANLKVRQKLMVLHNLFFLVLSLTVYFSLIPTFERHAESTLKRELALMEQMFSGPSPLPSLQIYNYREGTAEVLEIPPDTKRWLDENPEKLWSVPAEGGHVYRKDAASGLYRRVTLPAGRHKAIVRQAKLSLFVVLAGVYMLAVLSLEVVILPRYVYTPLRRLLEADRATRGGVKSNELIDEYHISNDELGQIMRSRNETIALLRKREDDLACTLATLQQTAEDLKRKNELLETAKQNIADQDRLVSLGMLSTSVAHELNTPLSVLHGSIEKLLETVEDVATRERLNRMLRVTDRLRRISESLLDFSRIRNPFSEAVSIRLVVEEAWALLAIDDKAADIRFINQVREQDIVVGNSDRLVQVFVNLLRNSLIAVKESGMILVKSRRYSTGGHFWIAITVEDNGTGIPPEVESHVFEAFVTSRLDSKGTGLGLTVAEGIVHQHGGEIAARNRHEGGACLEVRLPAAHREVVA